MIDTIFSNPKRGNKRKSKFSNVIFANCYKRKIREIFIGKIYSQIDHSLKCNVITVENEMKYGEKVEL